VNLGLSFGLMVLAVVLLFTACVWLMEKGTGTRE
jgi:hypothetical protein